MSVDLTQGTKEVVAHLFNSSMILVVEELLVDECGDNLPLYQEPTPEGLERIRFAVLKICNGNEDKLIEVISLAKRDWRDVLVWAGFADHLNAHNEWQQV